MTLDIKDEFLAVKAAGRAFGIYGGELFNFEKPASLPRGGVGGVEGKQGACGTAGRHQELTPRQACTAGVFGGPVLGQTICEPGHGTQGYGLKFTIRR